MNVFKLPLSELRKPKENSRIHPDKQIREIMRSVEQFGQIRPIVIDEDNIMWAGNGLYEALTRLGWAEADVERKAGLTRKEKIKMMLADNKVYGLGIDDLDVFDNFLVELKDDLNIPGFDEDILRTMVSEAQDVTEKLKEYGTLDNEEIEDIKEAREQKEQIISQAQKAAQSSSSNEDTEQSIVCPGCGKRIWL